MQGLVSDIQRFSVHDGPGIRTTLFLKGCNLRCAWCHNPETLLARAEMQYFPQQCIGCAECAIVCPQHGHHLSDGQHQIDRTSCTACGACVRGCYSGALQLVGREMTVEEAMGELRSDLPFYQQSGGGITISGGEPLLQADFTLAVLQACRAEGITTAIETNLCYPWQRLAPLLPYLDVLMFDLKMMDAVAHARWTGADNQQILNNARRLMREEMQLIVRTPLIAGINDSVEEISAIAEFLATLPGLCYYDLLPYHPLGVSKSQALGVDAGIFDAPSPERMQQLLDVARGFDIEVRCSGRSRL